LIPHGRLVWLLREERRDSIMVNMDEDYEKQYKEDIKWINRSIASTGRKFTEETRRKISEARKDRQYMDLVEIIRKIK